MNVVTIMSAKGGVGKSTLSANLGVALHMLGFKVLVIDFDSQNSLRFHFSFNRSMNDGVSHSINNDLNWNELIQQTPSGLSFLSYGVCEEEQIQALERVLSNQPNWLHNKLEQMDLDENTVVIIDTPPGSSVYVRHALLNSHIVIAVTLPDAGSYTTLPQLKYLIETYCSPNPNLIGYGVVINQIDQSKQLSKDMRRAIQNMFKENLVGDIHLDQSLSEALAYGQSIFQYNPHSESAQDIMQCAQWIERKLEK